MGRRKGVLTMPQGQIELAFQIIGIPLHLLSPVNRNINSHFCKLALDDFGSRHTNRCAASLQCEQETQRFSVFFTDTGAFIHQPAGLIEKLICHIRIIVIGCFQLHIRIGRITGSRNVCRRFITVRNSYRHFLFINGIGYGLPYTNIR